MQWSNILHWLTAIFGIGGVIVMIAYWLSLLRVKWTNNIIGTKGGSFMGFSSKHLYEDAKLLFYTSLVLGINVLLLK